MNLTTLKLAKAEALRFVKKVNALEQDANVNHIGYFFGSKHTGAVKRASMDLTRSLADLRKPG